MLRVFVVEDSASLRERLVALIQSLRGVDIIGHAADARSAIDQIQELKPDAVVLDIRLAQGNGYQVLKHINGENKPIIIVLTNYPYPQYREKFLASGADYFFDKSTEFDRVLSVLKDLVKRRRPENGNGKANSAPLTSG